MHAVLQLDFVKCKLFFKKNLFLLRKEERIISSKLDDFFYSLNNSLSKPAFLCTVFIY